MNLKGVTRLSLLLQYRVLDFIDKPRLLRIICLASPRLTENNYYWRERYKDFFREFTDNLGLENQPKALYHAFMVRALILEDVQDRRVELDLALRKVNLYIRSDSKLCSHWINGLAESKWTLELVVKKCIEMKWLFDYCDFNHKMRNYLKQNNLEYSEKTFSLASAHFLALTPVPEELPWVNADPNSRSTRNLYDPHRSRSFEYHEDFYDDEDSENYESEFDSDY